MGCLTLIPSQAAASQLFIGAYLSPTALALAIQPGGTITGTIRFQNLGQVPQTITSRTADLTVSPGGELAVAPASASRIILGETLILSEISFTLTKGAEKNLAYQLSLPADTPLGDHLGVVIFRLQESNPQIEFGVPILVRVTTNPVSTRLSVRNTVELPPFLPQSTPSTTTSTDDLAKPATGVELADLSLPQWSIFGIRANGEVFNTNDTVESANVKLTYRRPAGQTITTDEIHLPFLAPGSHQSFTSSKATYWQSVGKLTLPYLGPLAIEGRLAGQPSSLVASTFVFPWWALLLFLISGFALILRLAALHPLFPHQPIRYQGRLAFSILLFLALSVNPIGQIQADQLETTGTIAVTASVPLYAQAFISVDNNQLVVETQSNYWLQIITNSGTYLVKPGDPALRLPLDSSILILGTFGEILPS